MWAGIGKDGWRLCFLRGKKEGRMEELIDGLEIKLCRRGMMVPCFFLLSSQSEVCTIKPFMALLNP